MTTELRAKLASDLSISQAIIFENYLPSDPSVCISLDEGAGMGSIGFFNENLGLEQPDLRVRVRGIPQDASTPRATIETVGQYLEGLGAFVASGVRYLALTPLGSPFILERDGKERVVWARKFLAMKEQA